MIDHLWCRFSAAGYYSLLEFADGDSWKGFSKMQKFSLSLGRSGEWWRIYVTQSESYFCWYSLAA